MSNIQGGFDLNGKYYPNREDAINAEVAQCNEIDMMRNNKRMDYYERDLNNNARVYSQYIEQLFSEIAELKDRLNLLEAKSANF